MVKGIIFAALVIGAGLWTGRALAAVSPPMVSETQYAARAALWTDRRIQDEERAVERRFLHGPLQRPRLVVTEQAAEVRRLGASRPFRTPEALFPECFFRPLARSANVVRVGGRLEAEAFSIRPDLVGDCDRPREEMRQCGRIG